MKYLIFVAFLLATANAFPFHVYKRDEHLVRLYKRATDFTPCQGGSPVPLNVTTDSDPKIGADFIATIMFVTDKDYPKMFLTTTFTEDDGSAIDTGVTTADLCAKTSGITCPIPKGQQVTVNAKTTVPKAAVLPYDIEFNVNDGAVTVGCSSANITTDGTGGGGGTPPPAAPGAAPGAAPPAKGGAGGGGGGGGPAKGGAAPGGGGGGGPAKGGAAPGGGGGGGGPGGPAKGGAAPGGGGGGGGPGGPTGPGGPGGPTGGGGTGGPGGPGGPTTGDGTGGPGGPGGPTGGDGTGGPTGGDGTGGDGTGPPPPSPS